MCLCCKRRKKGSRRRADQRTSSISPGDKSIVPVDPITGNLNDVKKVPESKLMSKQPLSNKPELKTKVACIDAGEAIVMPLKGKGALKRVFLGIGWRSSGKTVDVDCTCAPYSKGVRVPEDTVWFQNLASRKYMDDKGKAFVSTKHSGDVLTGQGGDSALEDLERIYLDMESSPDDVDCFAFEANVFTRGLKFSDLDSAYIRLVNVDTNQEIIRCDVNKENLGDTNVILLAKLFRAKDRWVLHSCIEPRAHMLVQTPIGTIEKDMFLAKLQEVDTSEETAPVSHIMDRGGGGGGDLVGREKKQYELSRKQSTGKRASRPSNSYLMPAVALGTAASIGAAVLIFQYGSPVTLNDMQSFANGSYGVDFSVLASAFQPSDCGCLSDFDVCGQNLGDSCGHTFDFLCQGGMCESLDIENPCQCCGVICVPLKDCFGSVIELVGDGVGNVCDAISGGAGAICGCQCEDMCDVVFICDKCGCPDVGGSLDKCGTCCEACSDGLGDVMDHAGDAVSKIGESAGPALQDVGHVLGDLGKEIMKNV